MTRMTGPDCVVMCNFINTHTHIYTHTVASDPDNLKSSKGTERKAQCTQGLSKNCTTSEESAFPLSRLIRRFRIKYHRYPLERINASDIE